MMKSGYLFLGPNVTNSNISETPNLNDPSRREIGISNDFERLSFNFKTIGDRPIFSNETALEDISLSVYLNGLISTS